MAHRSTPVTLAAIAAGVLVLASSAAAQKAGDTAKAEKVRDRALAKVEAWRAQPAENILDKDREAVGDTSPFATADAVLQAQNALGKDSKVIDTSLKTLADQAKADAANPVPEYYRGMVLVWTGKNDQATAAFKAAESRARKAVEASSDDAVAQFYLAASLIRQKKGFDAARKALDAAAQNGFDRSMVEFQRGLSFLLQEDWQTAKDAFDAVEKLEPRYAHLYFYRAMAWDKLKRTDMLLNDLDQFVKLAPNAPEAKTAKAILASAK
ncbi:MAG TPA: hypothetical protein VLB51_04445 [Methylomirabilota bacterium]|nr:hypothetical protein [Methylomirabilota bacterium]